MTKATKYIRRIKKVDYIHAKQYLELNGWTVVLFNTPAGNTLIDKLGLQNYANRTDGFVYEISNLKYVFINGQMSDKDKLITLLHETGHIELQHDLNGLDKIDEVNAWWFTYNILYYSKNVLKRIIACVIIFLLTLAIAFACYNIFHSIKNAKHKVYVTQSGNRYHASNCYFIQGKETISLELKEAQKQYEPCIYCNPHK